jgi:hypothetical protein
MILLSCIDGKNSTLLMLSNVNEFMKRYTSMVTNLHNYFSNPISNLEIKFLLTNLLLTLTEKFHRKVS